MPSVNAVQLRAADARSASRTRSSTRACRKSDHDRLAGRLHQRRSAVWAACRSPSSRRAAGRSASTAWCSSAAARAAAAPSSQLLQALCQSRRILQHHQPATSIRRPPTRRARSPAASSFPARVPFAVYVEYAGEDTSRGRNYLLGNSALSWGIHFPRLCEALRPHPRGSPSGRTAGTCNSIWLDGMTNYGMVVSNWFGDQRVFDDGVGGRSAMARLGWDAWFGGQVELRYRTLENQVYGAVAVPALPRTDPRLLAPVERRRHRRRIRYRQGRLRWQLHPAGRLRALRRRAAQIAAAAMRRRTRPRRPRCGQPAVGRRRCQRAARRTDLTGTRPKTDGLLHARECICAWARAARSPTTAIWAARVEYDELGGTGLLGVRLIDYRYRFTSPLAIAAFLGAARYSPGDPGVRLLLRHRAAVARPPAAPGRRDSTCATTTAWRAITCCRAIRRARARTASTTSSARCSSLTYHF